ncbi:hypothetical protein Tco_1173516 [Tanacetum coccineum]
MYEIMNQRRHGDRNGRRSKGKKSENPFFEGDGSSFDEQLDRPWQNQREDNRRWESGIRVNIPANDIQETNDQLVSHNIGGLRVQIMDSVNMFDPLTLSDAYQRTLGFRKENRRVGDSSSTPYRVVMVRGIVSYLIFFPIRQEGSGLLGPSVTFGFRKTFKDNREVINHVTNNGGDVDRLNNGGVDVVAIIILKCYYWLANDILGLDFCIQLEEEKARRRGHEFNWETATYGKVRKRDTTYQRQVFTRKRVFTIPNMAYPPSAIRRTGTYEEYELKNPMTRDLEEPWLDNGVPYQLCDHICEPYHFKNGITKWPTYSSDIDGFCNGGELPGMVKVGKMTYFQDHNCFGNFHELYFNVLVKLQEYWWKINADEVAPFTRSESYSHESYANIKTEKAQDPYLKINNIFDRNYNTSTQDNQGHDERMNDPTLDPSVCKIRKFEMMKYSFNADEDYIAIKESEYLNHSKDSLDAYRELLRIINEGWAVATPDEE